ncbi:MAG: HAD hydrolase-like protein [Novosphingobium sp.]
MKSFPFDIVGFDLDGTLLDTHLDLAAAVNHALGLAGRAAVPADSVRALIGGGSAKMLERALALTGGMVPEFAELQQALIGFYQEHIAVHTRLFPGGEAMLDGLAARGVKLAVVTNKLEHLAVRVIAELGLAERFFAVIGGDTLGPGRGKPAPDLLLEMVRRSGALENGGRSAYVGDTSFDTLAARAAGMPCVVASFGFNDLPPDELGADAVIDHFDALIDTLSAL